MSRVNHTASNNGAGQLAGHRGVSCPNNFGPVMSLPVQLTRVGPYAQVNWKPGLMASYLQEASFKIQKGIRIVKTERAAPFILTWHWCQMRATQERRGHPKCFHNVNISDRDFVHSASDQRRWDYYFVNYWWARPLHEIRNAPLICISGDDELKISALIKVTNQFNIYLLWLRSLSQVTLFLQRKFLSLYQLCNSHSSRTRTLCF